MKRFLFATALLLTTATAPAFAQDSMGMAMKGPKPAPATAGYSFDLGGPAKAIGGGKNVVAVRLMHDSKPVTGAIIIQTRADMSPMGMASMKAPIKPLGEKQPGTYSFEVANGSLWKKPDDWAITLSAKVQGVAQTVTGTVTVKLSP